jgi:antibiotic biosynthesis monooxygenase (ABM) superfamily enzyme
MHFKRWLESHDRKVLLDAERKAFADFFEIKTPEEFGPAWTRWTQPHLKHILQLIAKK